MTYMNIESYFSNTTVVCQFKGSLVIKLNNHWQIYFQSNVVEKSEHIKHILSTLCFYEKYLVRLTDSEIILCITLLAVTTASHKNTSYPNYTFT